MAQAKSEKTWQVAILGGGIAGGVAAIHAARAGLSTLVIEKEKYSQHKVCGEFLSSEGVALLAEYGIDVNALGAAPISHFRLHGPRNTCETRLPFEGRGLSRHRLDDEILRVAEKHGAEIRRGLMAREITGEEPFRIETNDDVITAYRLIVATGKSEFRALQKRSGRDSGMAGYKMHLRLKPSQARRLKEHIDLFVFKHGYGGISLVEDGIANFCFLIERSALKTIGSDWDSLAFHIARNNREASRYLDGAEPVFRQALTVGSVPYGFLRRGPGESGVFYVGDQMGVIASLTGDGMSIAALTGREAARAIISDEGLRMNAPSSAFEYQRRMRRHLKAQIDFSLHLHQLFKNPRAVDLSTKLVRQVPSVIDMIFMMTRTRMDLDQNALSLFAGELSRTLLAPLTHKLEAAKASVRRT